MWNLMTKKIIEDRAPYHDPGWICYRGNHGMSCGERQEEGSFESF